MILSDVCEFIVDCPHSTAPDEGEGYPLIRTPNVGKGRLDLNGVHRVSESVYKQRIQRGAPRANDLIFAREAPAGNVALVQENQTVCLGQRTVLIRPNVQKVNPQYLVYYLLSPKPQYELLGTANGATVAHVNLPAIRNLKIELPEKSVQDKIGTILVTYDDLIENNQKQIKLLEEAAQRLYKEWFVDLRFPGHENTKIVDGVPEGWSKNPIQDFISYEIGGGWGEELQNEKSMIPAYVIRGTDIKGLVNGQLQSVPYRYHTAGSLETRKLLDGDIVFEVSGGSKTEGVARTVRIIDLMLKTWDNSVICASFCKRIKPIPSFSQYLYDSFRWMRLNGKTQEYDKKSASSIVNYRWKDFLAQEKILKPDEETISRYNNIAGTIYTKIIVCSCQIEQAKMKRDLLLPKLMNGEVEV